MQNSVNEAWKCTKPNHKSLSLDHICLNKDCYRHGPICVNCLNDHKEHKSLSLKTLASDLKSKSSDILFVAKNMKKDISALILELKYKLNAQETKLHHEIDEYCSPFENTLIEDIEKGAFLNNRNLIKLVETFQRFEAFKENTLNFPLGDFIKNMTDFLDKLRLEAEQIAASLTIHTKLEKKKVKIVKYSNYDLKNYDRVQESIEI